MGTEFGPPSVVYKRESRTQRIISAIGNIGELIAAGGLSTRKREREERLAGKPTDLIPIDIVLKSVDESVHITDHVERSFGGTVGKLPLKGIMNFVPRGSSGFDDIPLAEVTIYEPSIFKGEHEVSAAPYDGQKADSAGEVHWYVYDDEAVIASIRRVLDHQINAHIEPLFENPD